MSLYNLRLLAHNKYQIAKFDSDFNVAAVYNLEPKGFSFTCDCPANARSVVTKPCKHKRMLPLMLGAANTNRFYDPETRTWHEPLGDLLRPEAGDLKGREALPHTEMHSRVATETVSPSPTGMFDPIAGEAVGSTTESITQPVHEATSGSATEGVTLKPTQAPTIRRR